MNDAKRNLFRVDDEGDRRIDWESTQSLLPQFFDRRPAVVARQLLGCGFARRIEGVWVGGWIVETEAYLSSRDAASHSARGEKPGNASMFGRPSTLYVYPIHAKHCVNLVTESVGRGSAVLIRALQPVWGIDRMIHHRGFDPSETTDGRLLTTGPGRLCQSLAIDRSCDGVDPILDRNWRVFAGPKISSSRVTTTTRIGISQSAELPLRFFVDGNRYVSGLVRQHRRPRRDSL
ncbi:DNA-3-methyladenine glycosylase [Rhodopirellula europaea]|jgi:DNA-3-methyladenine glycosylase|uniref:Putative 3-methyladenine DNA glycosylase n=1 Tax=Rhodopirellula europaea SH398 TaxID=1263868 RepID=M5SIH8_9BACT|nr:DNA-3-methyladenine glycosylase [Rhodopirellula europaea]EMI26004.1 Methylpurine-DNA glycosylase (MPG) [Rhodopirellula europaea SH398]